MDEVLKIIERLINERHVNGAEAIKLINAVNDINKSITKDIFGDTIKTNLPGDTIKTSPLPLGTIIKYDFEKSPNSITTNLEDKCEWVTTASDNGHKIGYYLTSK